METELNVLAIFWGVIMVVSITIIVWDILGGGWKNDK
jgi:hypothetical protein